MIAIPTTDAKLLEDAFEQRLTALPSPDEPSISGDPAEATVAARAEVGVSGGADPDKPTTIDKSVLAVPAPRRYRDRDHLRHVTKQPCLICGRNPSDPHHLRFMQPRALGRKASDEFTVPLCRIHHRLVRRVGNEAAWWQDVGIDPITHALEADPHRCGADCARVEGARHGGGSSRKGRRPCCRQRSARLRGRYAHHDGRRRRAVSHLHRHRIRRSPDRRPPRDLADLQQALSTWLRRRYYQATGDAPSAAALTAALNLFEARAQFEGPERKVHVRIAEDQGHIYLDLADAAWRAAEIGSDGWRVVAEPPVRFRRPPGMLPLPMPQRGGSLEQLTSLLNLPDRGDLVLVTTWLLATLRHGGPYPL